MSFLYVEYLFLLFPLAMFVWVKQTNLQVRFHLVVLVLVLFSLSRPVIKKEDTQGSIQTQDIIIAFDVSYSMRATDIKPSRYLLAKEFITEFVQQNPQTNVMLIAFSTNPLVLCPPTTDHSLTLLAMQSINLEYILTKGTSLKNLFIQLQKIDIEKKDLILLSDGGEERDVEILVEALKQKPNSLHIVALAKPSGVTITKEDGTLLTDEQGNLVVSKLNPTLYDLSVRLHANYVSPQTSLAQKIQQVQDALQTDITQKKQQKNYQELYYYPLLLATLLFLVIHTKGLKYFLLLMGFLSSTLHASVFDEYYLQSAIESYKEQHYVQSEERLKKVTQDSLQKVMLQAALAYKMAHYEEALQRYKSIKTRSIEVKQQIYYNIANCFAKEKRYSEAKKFYAKVLVLGSDIQAKENLQKIVFLEDQAGKGEGKTLPQTQKLSSQKSQMELKKEHKQRKDTKAKMADEKYIITSKMYELINKGYIDEKKPW